MASRNKTSITLEKQVRLAAIIASSDDVIIAKTLDGTILDWNAAAERLFGYSAADAVGRRITLIVPPESLSEEKRILSRLRRGQAIDHYETIRLAKDGRRVPVSISISPLRDDRGKVIAASTIMRDVTERKRAEAALSDREERLRALISTAADSIVTIDERGVVESVNPATERLFQYTMDEIIGQNVSMLMPEPFHSEHDGYLREYCRTGIARIIGIGREVTGRRKDGKTFPMNLSVSEVHLGSRRMFTGIVHDLSERRRLERQVLEAAAIEQRRIGQDLHDGLCQDLVGIAFGIDTAIRNLPPDATASTELLQKLAMAVRDAAGQARDLSHGLNPVDLNAGGLDVALDNLAKKVSLTFHIQCAFEWDQIALVRDDATATHLYRIAQEAVGNSVKHGKASRVQIALVLRDGAVELSITDNGAGMPESVVHRVRQGLVSTQNPSRESATGIGLQTMHYRTRVIGGTFAVSARQGGGSVIRCLLGRDPGLAAKPASKKASGKLVDSKRGRT